MDIRQAIHDRPMRWPQIAVVAICIMLTMIDGYEIIVMPFVMPHLAKAWGWARSRSATCSAPACSAWRSARW